MGKIKRTFVASFLLTFSFFSAFTLKSFADQYVVKSSITMNSSHINFAGNEPGSWQMKKSAKWIARNKAQIKFEVNSIPKTAEGNDLDVMFVLDNSGSMGGAPLEKIKADANEAIDTTLSNSNNRISLITFNSTSQILSNWSNNANNLKNLVNGINATGSTNYYSGFKDAEKILDGTAPGGTDSPYEKQSGRELIMVFMSDGQPNEGTPNEVVEYNYLKKIYPYISINVIQYNMGEEFIVDRLEAISDNQFISNANTPANILLDAGTNPFVFDEFILTDLLNDDYWNGATITKITQILGEPTTQNTGTLNPTNVTINKTATPPTIKWDLSGIYRSGTKASLTLEVVLKDEYKDEGGLFPTNKGAEITSKLPETPNEDVVTSDTPVLKGDYGVHYDANKPTDCNLGGDAIPEDKNYTVFSTVEIDSGIPTCTNPADNYEFKGWEIINPTDPADNTKVLSVERIGSDYFIMPSTDVTLKAIWTRPTISKAMDGTVVEDSPAYFEYGNNVAQKMRGLAGNRYAPFDAKNTNIKAIKSADSLPADFTPTIYNTVSTSSSPHPIYMWFDNTNSQGIIYYYTDASPGRIFLNPQSGSMLNNLRSLTDISGLADWNTSSVTDMSSMFKNCTSLTDLTPISGWNTSSVTNMKYMFGSAGDNYDYYEMALTDLTPLSGWDTSSVTDMSYMFRYCRSLADLTPLADWNTSSLTNTSYMFHNCDSIADLTPLADWSTSSLTNTSYMFYNCDSIADLTPLSGWDTSSLTNTSYMFYNCDSIADLTPLSGWDTSSVTDMSYMFRYCRSIADLTPLADWNTSSVTNMSNLFSGLSSIADLTPLADWNTSSVTNMSNLFSGLSSLTDLTPITNWNTSSVTNMSSMFSGCRSLTDLTPISGWNTSSITDMSSMFNSCTSLTDLTPISGWNTSSVTNMSLLFANSTSLSDLTPLADWNTSSVTNMFRMFSDCDSLNNLSGLADWNTSSVTDMSSMFQNCNSIADLTPLADWNTSSVTDMSYMFGDSGTQFNHGEMAIADLTPLADWNTSSVTDMSYMFRYCVTLTNLTPIASWDISKVTTIREMFYGDNNIDATALNGWDVSNVTKTDAFTCPANKRPSWY